MNGFTNKGPGTGAARLNELGQQIRTSHRQVLRCLLPDIRLLISLPTYLKRSRVFGSSIAKPLLGPRANRRHQLEVVIHGLSLRPGDHLLSMVRSI